MLKRRVEKLEEVAQARKPGGCVVIYDNDPFDRPRPSEEEIAQAAHVIHVEYVEDWRGETGR